MNTRISKIRQTLLGLLVIVSALLVTNVPAHAAIDSTTVPAYSGAPFTIINNNIPDFSPKMIQDATGKTYESYSSLDVLGRCGVCVSSIDATLMPTDQRGKIGSIKPSGWQTVKYNGVVDGNYLYNRCHLIAWQLTGENANKKNLITGTRYMNVEGMLPFENLVSDYVKNGGKVLYRVTPIFQGNNLLASGVQIEAYSLSDNGKTLCFNVYCYNVQPGIIIDYSNGNSCLASTTITQVASQTQATPVVANAPPATNTVPAASAGQAYVANKNTHKFHYPTCSSVGDMKAKNRWDVVCTRDDLINQGYVPCKRCYP